MKEAVVGKAVALQRGHYKQANGLIVRIREGEVFNLVAGRETASWFRRLDDEPAAPAAEVETAVTESVTESVTPTRRAKPAKAEQAGDIV